MDNNKRKVINELTTEKINNFYDRKKEIMKTVDKLNEIFNEHISPENVCEYNQTCMGRYIEYTAGFNLSEDGYPNISEYFKIGCWKINTTDMSVEEIKDEIIKYLYRRIKRKGK